MDIKDLRELVLKTEEELRDLVSSVLTREYGTKWETDSNIGWSNATRKELENRMAERKKEFQGKAVSNRLIDYCYIHNLKSLICKNEIVFKSIIQDWNKTMHYFDELGKYRDPIMHNTNPLSQFEISLCEGICGEFIKIIEHWKKGFSRKILSYAGNLNFDVLENGNESEEQKQALDLANKWIDNIKALSSEPIKTIPTTQGETIVIKFQEGEITIRLPKMSRSYNGNYAKTAGIYFETTSKDVLQKVIVEGKHSYWNLEWTISDALDVHSLIPKVQESTGRVPSSKGGTGSEPNIHWRQADYAISIASGRRIRVVLSSIDSTKSKIGITHDDAMFDNGFKKAHEVFSPDSVLSIIYGEIPLQKMQEMIIQAIS